MISKDPKIQAAMDRVNALRSRARPGSMNSIEGEEFSVFPGMPAAVLTEEEKLLDQMLESTGVVVMPTDTSRYNNLNGTVDKLIDILKTPTQ